MKLPWNLVAGVFQQMMMCVLSFLKEKDALFAERMIQTVIINMKSKLVFATKRIFLRTTRE